MCVCPAVLHTIDALYLTQCSDPRDDGDQPQYKASFGDICNHFQYPEPIPNTHGFGHNNNTKVEDGFHDYSVVDKVRIPDDLDAGDYLISWRWDAEQSNKPAACCRIVW